MNHYIPSCLLLLTIIFCVNECKEMKTIQLPLHHKNPIFNPSSDSLHNGTIITEHEAERRDLSSYGKIVGNFEDLQYYTTLYVGENQQEMTFGIHTGIDYVWIPLNNCTG